MPLMPSDGDDDGI